MSKRDKFKKEVKEINKLFSSDFDNTGIISQRKKEKIKRIIRLIERIWKKYPNLRLCQLIGNCFESGDNYHIEDDELEERLRKFYKI